MIVAPPTRLCEFLRVSCGSDTLIEGLMSSKFLLHLSSDSIDLERQDASGHWHRLGSVSPDSKHLTEALAHLRQTVVTEASDPLEVLVALPADQIKRVDLDHSDTSTAALQQALAGQTPYEFHELCVDCLPTPQGQTIAAIAQETLEEAENLTQAFGFKAAGFVALPGGAWENNFSVFQRPGYGAQSRPRAYSAAVPEAKAIDPTPLAALAAGPAAAPTPPIAAPAPSTSSRPELSARVGGAEAAPPAPQVTDTKAVTPETLPAASAHPQARQALGIAQYIAKIRLRLGRRAPKPPPAHIKTVQAQVGGKPKYFGLILTTLLLLFMFTVAALAATLGRDKISAWLGLSPAQTQMTAALPADPVGQVIEIGLEPLNAPSAPADQTAFAPQARDDALSLQEAEIALKDPENDAEPPIGLFAEEPPAVRALAIGPATEPAATPPADAEGYVAAPDPNLQSDEEPPLLDMPWLRPDPLPDKENRAPTVAQNQTEEPSAPDAAPLAEPVNIPPVTAALAQTDQSVAPSPREDASPEETNPLAAVRPMARPASLPSPVRPKTLPDGKSLARSLRPQSRPRAIELAALLPTPVVAKPSEIQAPTATSRKTVTRSATRKNVINLRNINLIGITGTTRLRNALVRLSNGQVVKVRIGDRLDGGRVTDISSKTLTYAKSGRSITLDMPRG
jgi:hypothetical protein